MKRGWKEAVVDQSSQHPDSSPEGWRKNARHTSQAAGKQADIRTRLPSNTSWQCYR